MVVVIVKSHIDKEKRPLPHSAASNQRLVEYVFDLCICSKVKVTITNGLQWFRDQFPIFDLCPL